MGDVFTKRVEAMHTVRGRGTKLKYRSHPKAFGSPDFLVEGRLYLFCDGSFWHGRDWKELKQRLEASNNPDYWVKHIGSNRKRDRKVNRTLRGQGHVILRLWDTDVRKRLG